MGLDFDLHGFIEDMKACKGPYKCPYRDCGKVYKTYSGIHGHIMSHTNGGSTAGSGSRTPICPSSGRRSPVDSQPFFKSPLKETLFFNEADKTVEFESSEGSLQRLSVYDALELVSKEDWEATLSPSAYEPDKKQEEVPKTPTTSRPFYKKGKKTPKGSNKPDAAAEAKRTEGADNDRKILKLPEAHFVEIEDYDIEDAPPMPTSYFRFIEKPAEEQDEMVEYDMDEEDVAWLNMINEKRSQDGLIKIHEDQFELLMDRLEKESYFHVQTNGKDYSAPIDDDAICCVCMDGECSNTNVILFCDLCNLAVHQECYGVPYIPEGQWLCRRCLQSPSRSVECCLCPNRGGAFKQTDDGRWAHVVCGLWIPEVRFANTVFLEPIDSIDNIPPARWKLSCRVCKQRGVGACIQCHKTNCYTAFHVTCGLLAGLHMKMDTVRESSAAGLSVTVRKTAYCDVHTPHDSDCKPKLDDVAALGISTPKQKGRSPKKGEVGSPVPVLFRGLMNFSPQCPWDKVQKIASLISVQRKNQFFQRLMAYWTLKRQTRNGVPLIRRLQFAKANKDNKAPETPQKNAHHSKKKKEREKAAIKKAKDGFKDMIEERRSLRRLRQDLERVRLLCELIRKREQRKRELIVVEGQLTQIKCFPFVHFMRTLLEQLKEIDQQDIFADPVSLDDVPDYLDHIKIPMDFTTMGKKLDGLEYIDIDQFESDFNAMVENCMSYNERDTLFFRAGVKMRDHGGIMIRQAKREIESIGFDPESGLHSEERLTSKEEFSDDKLMKEIDNFVNDDKREDMALDVHLKRLLELQDKAMFLHHPVAKVKRQKLLKQEITKVRRKLSMDKAGTSPGFRQKTFVDGEDPVESNEKVVGGSSKKPKKQREVSPIPEEDTVTPARRLRAGKEIEAATSDKKAIAAKRGRKRKQSATKHDNDDEVTESPPAKRKATEDSSSNLAKTPVKTLSAGQSTSPAKSPAGVNRRNAVLFTRKKQAAAAPSSEAADDKPGEDEDTSAATTDKKTKKKQPQTILEDDIANQETEVQSPAAVPLPESTAADKSQPKKRGRKPRGTQQPSETKEEEAETPKSPPEPSRFGSWRGASAGPSSIVPADSASFKVYRRGGEVGETDEDTQSESATDAIGTSEDDSDDGSDADDSDASSTAGRSSNLRIPLEPLDLVWAKCRGYPWYPALIINPKMPRTGYLHNGVPIPVPPQDVLDMASTHETPHYLILFFDAKRTWQWLQRDKLEPLGVNSETDKAKLVQSKKPSERKAVKKAYEDAIFHRCRVTGESAAVSGESSETEDSSNKDNNKN